MIFYNSDHTSSLLMRKNCEVLLIIAHPDDEVMFFAPLLNTSAIYSIKLSILCLSTGNYEGLGETRVKELKKCAAIYNIASDNIHIVDHIQLQDGMNNIWPIKLISEIISQYINLINPTIILTFDEYGVSNHPNHIATYQGVKYYLNNILNDKLNIIGFKLNSKNVFRKFIGLFDIIFTVLLNSFILLNIFGLYKVYKGMYAHNSQNVWYRKIFIFFSSFTYINSFSKIN